MEISMQDRKFYLAYFRTQMRASQVMLESDVKLSQESKKWLEELCKYCKECHKLIRKKKTVIPDRPDTLTLSEKGAKEIQAAIERLMESIKNAQ